MTEAQHSGERVGRVALLAWLMAGLGAGLLWVPLLDRADPGWAIAATLGLAFGVGVATGFAVVIEVLGPWFVGGVIGVTAATELIYGGAAGAEDPAAYVLVGFAALVVVPAGVGFVVGRVLRRFRAGDRPTIRQSSVLAAIVVLLVVGALEGPDSLSLVGVGVFLAALLVGPRFDWFRRS